ncbi:MAG: DUF4863 family protein [Myxococcota bacterium]
MADLDTLRAALKPILDVAKSLDASSPGAKGALEEAFPLQSTAMQSLRALVREGIDGGWLADRESGGIRFSRVQKAGEENLSVDAVHMDRPGPGHTHPEGEFDLCFAVSGEPRFDGHPEGWVVYPPGSWHVPTVSGGVMDILYFLPSGAIRFEPKP